MSMNDPFMAQISWVAFDFAPRGWAKCDGQMLPINQHQSLYSLLGTMYGGDGRTTFGLPDLRGRALVGVGAGPGLGTITQAQKFGVEQVVLTPAELPAHSHGAALKATDIAGTLNNPDGNVLADSGTDTIYASVDPKDNVLMADGTVVIAPEGGGQPVFNRDPYLAIHAVISLQGIFPSRS